MKYLSFTIQNYRAIIDPLTINFEKNSLIPLVGINECGKTTILQAIYCFDEVNDSYYGGKHMDDTKNLYLTKEKGEPVITAHIEISYDDLLFYYTDAIEQLQERNKPKKDVENPDQSVVVKLETYPNFPLIKKEYKGKIAISRNLITKRYAIHFLEKSANIPESLSHETGTDIVQGMPFILYNDDFMDRPPNSIDILKNSSTQNAEWYKIYDQLFKATSPDYSITGLVEEKDPRRQDAILSDVEDVLNKTLTKAWKTFSLGKKSEIRVKLKYIQQNTVSFHGKLQIKIVERIEERERFFDVIDRSKGFLWFFNFVMKLEFNPKLVNSNAQNTIYLLDEPGSYLHYSAQGKLCLKLVDIAKKHGVVIYCTHSHTLLNPDLIPLNNIYIVQKDKQKRISAKTLPNVQTNSENISAYQPIYEALQVSALDHIKGSESILAVEGIYDKYAISLMLKFDFPLAILPGTNAHSIIKNIQYFNAYGKKYAAIWDNDKEGVRALNEAKNFFGDHESQKFDLLPKGSLDKRRMEGMFLASDYILINTMLGYEKNSNYENSISGWYFAEKELKDKIYKNVSDDAKANFLILKGIIEKRLHNKNTEVAIPSSIVLG